LMNCSDYSTAWVCRTCGSLISLGYEETYLGHKVGADNIDPSAHLGPNGEYCRVCRAEEAERDKAAQAANDDRPDPLDFSIARHAQMIERRGKMEVIAIPYVFKYLCAELAAMGIRLTVSVS